MGDGFTIIDATTGEVVCSAARLIDAILLLADAYGLHAEVEIAEDCAHQFPRRAINHLNIMGFTVVQAAYGLR